MLDIKLSQNWQPEALSPFSLKEDAGMAALLNKKRLLYSGEELKYGVGGTTLLISSAEMRLILTMATILTPNGAGLQLHHWLQEILSFLPDTQ